MTTSSIDTQAPPRAYWPDRAADTPLEQAADYASYHRRTKGGRVILVVGGFKAITWDDIRPVVAQSLGDDLVIVAVSSDPAADLDQRRALASWLRFVDFTVPLDRPASELAEAIGANLVVNLEVGPQ